MADAPSSSETYAESSRDVTCFESFSTFLCRNWRYDDVVGARYCGRLPLSWLDQSRAFVHFIRSQSRASPDNGLPSFAITEIIGPLLFHGHGLAPLLLLRYLLNQLITFLTSAVVTSRFSTCLLRCKGLSASLRRRVCTSSTSLVIFESSKSSTNTAGLICSSPQGA
ncbi:hypothetical protein PSPO01_10033 [Paraphaeosphaeria sporulosa]